MNLFSRSKKRDEDQNSMLEAIVDLNLKHVNIFLVDPNGEEDLGRSQFLRSEDKIYLEDESVYLTTPDKLKSQSTDKEPDKPKSESPDGENAPKP